MGTISLSGFAQQNNKSSKEGLKKISGPSRNHDVDIDIDIDEDEIERSIEEALESVEAALKNLDDVRIDPIHIDLRGLLDIQPIIVDIPNIDIEIDPIDIDLDELNMELDELDLDLDELDIDIDIDQDFDFDDDDQDDMNNKSDDRSKGLKKIN